MSVTCNIIKFIKSFLCNIENITYTSFYFFTQTARFYSSIAKISVFTRKTYFFQFRFLNWICHLIEPWNHHKKSSICKYIFLTSFSLPWRIAHMAKRACLNMCAKLKLFHNGHCIIQFHFMIHTYYRQNLSFHVKKGCTHCLKCDHHLHPHLEGHQQRGNM